MKLMLYLRQWNYVDWTKFPLLSITFFIMIGDDCVLGTYLHEICAKGFYALWSLTKWSKILQFKCDKNATETYKEIMQKASRNVESGGLHVTKVHTSKSRVGKDHLRLLIEFLNNVRIVVFDLKFMKPANKWQLLHDNASNQHSYASVFCREEWPQFFKAHHVCLFWSQLTLCCFQNTSSFTGKCFEDAAWIWFPGY